MKTLYSKDETALAIFRRAFPNTNFREIRVCEFVGPMALRSYWDGGSRDYFAVVRISDGTPLANIPQNGTPFDANSLELSALPEGFAVACHAFSGGTQYAYLYLNADNITKMLPQPSADMPEDQKTVLKLIRSYVSSCRREYAQRAGIGAERYAQIVSELKAKRLLTAQGGLTTDGKNLACALGA